MLRGLELNLELKRRENQEKNKSRGVALRIPRRGIKKDLDSIRKIKAHEVINCYSRRERCPRRSPYAKKQVSLLNMDRD